MDLKDSTRKQHFVSQVEQRLNAINPQATKDENKKIYAFTVVDRDSYGLTLDSKKGQKISGSLKLIDIFSFDVLEENHEIYNFEKLFRRYESGIRTNTENLISKISEGNDDIKSEVINIFASKLVNFVRNPYSVKKVLNTFPQLKQLKPAESVHSANFEKVLNGRKPQQEYLCQELGISDEDYRKWLATIFLLLTPFNDGRVVLLEQLIKDLYENPESFIMVMVYTYSEKACLLSDRGYSIPLPEDKHMAWDFNLYSKGFIRYIFGDIESLIPMNIQRNVIESYKAMPKQVFAQKIHNDLDALEQYNRHVVYQCHKKVFNSSPECYGL